MIDEGKALLARLRAMPPDQRRAALEAAGEQAVHWFDEQWPVWAHRGQIPEHDEWTIWAALTELLLAPYRAEPRISLL